MTKLHELLAIDADLNNIATNMLRDAQVTFTKRIEHFQGFTKSTHYLDEAKADLNTEENKEVPTTVDTRLEYALQHLTKLYDVLIQKEATNHTAKADLIVDGVTLAKDVPGTMLLGLESRLKAVRELISTVPTLNPALAWTPDTTRGDGVYRSQVQATTKTEKTLEYVTVAPATDKHPAQVKDWTVDKPVASIETVHLSGMWPVAKKAEVLDRIDVLMQAVKQARMRANSVEVVPGKIGDVLFKYIFDTKN